MLRIASEAIYLSLDRIGIDVSVYDLIPLFLIPLKNFPISNRRIDILVCYSIHMHEKGTPIPYSIAKRPSHSLLYRPLTILVPFLRWPVVWIGLYAVVVLCYEEQMTMMVVEMDLLLDPEDKQDR